MPRYGRTLLALLLCLPLTAIAQQGDLVTGTLDPSKLLSQYDAATWGLEDGLPQSVVEAVAQTADGHLWVGTQEGLARFDGVRFEVVDARETEGLVDNNVLALAAAADGGLWVGTRDGGLVHLDRDLHATTYGAEHGLPDPTVADIALDASGRVWLGTRAGLCMMMPGADRLSEATFTCYGEEAGLEDAYVRRLLVEPDGGMWLGTRAGVAWFEDGEIVSQAGLGGAAAEPITALHKSAEGGLWVGSLYGLSYLEGGTLHTPPGAERFAGIEVSALFEDAAGSLWVGTYGEGLHRLRDGTADALHTAGAADLNTVRSLLQDREGNLWVGTMGNGLARLRDAKFTPFGVPEGLGADMAYSVTTTPDGALWVGTDGGGAARIENGRVTRTLTTADGLPDDNVPAVLATADGALWVGVDGAGLCRYDGAVRCFDEADGLPDPFVIALYEDRRGTLWIGTDSGLARWTGRAFEPAAEGPAAPVVALAEAADGALWIGTFGAGLFRYTDGALAHYPDLVGEVVLALHARPDGTLWVGTDGDGVARVAPDGQGSFMSDRFTTREGLTSDGVFQILEDAQERLWMGSNRGVFRVALADFDRVARGRQPTLDLVVFGRADGMRKAEVNGGVQPAGAVGADGSLWFPTAAGAVTIDPSAIPQNALPPPVAVQRVVVSGTPLALGSGAPLVLPPGSNEFEFDYAGLSFFAPEQVQHRFILEGRDQQWTEAGTRRAAYYTDLPPGDYVFRVQAANNDGVWNETGAAVAFTLRPHFWQTAWFQVLCVLGVALAGFVAYRLRVRQLHARAEHLERVVEERTHELAEQKTIVEAQADELAALNRSLEQKVREQLEEILRGSRLRKFFPQKVVDRILSADEDVRVSSERRTVTVFFSDLTGFTRLSDTTSPDVVTRLLNEYLNAMVGLVEAHGGTLDKFMGDGIMVLFGAVDDMPPEVQARQAIRMGLAMQRAMEDLAATWAARGLGHRVAIRMGIHQAEVTVGNFGSDDLVEHTAIGAGVNLASRLEGACAPGEVLVSEAVHALAASAFAFGDPQRHRLKGIVEPVPAYPLRPDRNAAEVTGDGRGGEDAVAWRVSEER
jgi:ligand-binding sensor domain-containing protein/class 3 adenylate cyclase